jgi:general stress protein 26
VAQPAYKKNQDAHDKVWEMIKDMRIAQMVTQDEAGRLYARPMGAYQDKFHGELWFFTSKDSPKVAEIERNAHVLLCYANPEKNNYVSINGTARLVRDTAKQKELWHEFMRTWFPKGHDDPDIVLICVDVEEAEYWDSPSSTFVHAYGYVKAVLTGARPQGGENEKVSF